MKFRSAVIFILILSFIVLAKADPEDDSDDVDEGGDIIDPSDADDDGDDETDTDNGGDLDDGDDADDIVDEADDEGDDDLDTRIINGFTPDPLEYPFVVRLKVTFTNETVLCTGSLLSGSWVLTAGHCAKDATLIIVQLGLFTRTEGALQTINVGVGNIYVHEKFFVNETVVRNDIALLRLNPTANIFTPTGRIRPIAFACPSDGTFDGVSSRSCGWGITTDDAITSTETLQCVDMPVISNSECSESWPTFILPSHICTATIDNSTTCTGDSGGGLFVTDFFNGPQLIGITSFGSNPCAQTIPSVYTRITSYSNWITRHTLLICDIF